MPLSIPERQQKALARLVVLPQSDKDRLAAALDNAEPMVRIDRLATAMAKTTGLAQSDLQDYAFLLGNLYLTKQNHKVPIEELLAETIQVASGHEKPSPENLESFTAFLTRVMSMDQSFGLVAKASDLLFESEHLTAGTRILTDVRPIFTNDKMNEPRAAIITHNLRISYASKEGENQGVMFFALDHEDLVELRDLVTRAIEKEEKLVKKFGAVARILET